MLSKVTLFLLFTAAAASARTSLAVFVPLPNPATTKSRFYSSSLSSTTEYAAAAMNSVAFLEKMIAEKNTADVKFYHAPPRNENEHLKDDDSLLVPITSDEDDDKRNEHPRSFETIVEYTGKLWFIPGGGVRFRETIWIEPEQQQDNGKSSLIVHCDAQYHDGKTWVECSRVSCKFAEENDCIAADKTKNSCSDNEEGEERYGVDMTLDSDLLVKLPLPGPAARAFQKLIVRTFEKAAISYYNDLTLEA